MRIGTKANERTSKTLHALMLVSAAAIAGACAEEQEPIFLAERPRGPAVERSDEPAGAGTPDALAAPPNVSAPPAEAQRSASGLAWTVLREGTGTRRPGPTDVVEAHYSGWRAEDGRLFDSSVQRNEPLRIPVNRVIQGWQEGLQLMVEGERRRFWIPANLAYEGRPGPQGMLVFDVELLRIL